MGCFKAYLDFSRKLVYKLRNDIFGFAQLHGTKETIYLPMIRDIECFYSLNSNLL